MNNNNDKLPSHSIADHAFGAALGHVHAPGEDHDHEHEADDNLIEHGSQELARVELLSMGVDIGSSGTQIAFSRLHMYGPGEPTAMRRQVKTRETLYMSPVVLTPFRGDAEIDVDRLRGTLARAFEAAGLTPDDIETGIVIMTGAAARRVNAQAIVEALSQEAGDIVAAAAGDHMEAALAAAGSGAVERSRVQMQRVLNVDIGGATTKLALVENGRIMQTAALDVGGRLAVIDAQNRIARLENAGALHARRCGLHWTLGAAIAPGEREQLAGEMAQAMFAALAGTLPQPHAQEIWLTGPQDGWRCDAVMFSGGVAEYVYGREHRDFGDLGKTLGLAIARRIEAGGLPAPLLPPGECMRATVLGCSEYTVQLSGATSSITSHAKLLPRRNLPVLQPAYSFSGEIDAPMLARAIADHRAAFGDDDPASETAFAFRWRGDAEHGRVHAFAQGIKHGLHDRIEAGTNIYLMIEGDAALTLGAILRHELSIANEILVVDGIVLRDFDYVDIGRVRLPSGAVPVTVKSLQFAGNR